MKSRSDLYLVLVTGSRAWQIESRIREDLRAIRSKMADSGRDVVVVHGNAPGADRAAHRIAISLGLTPVAVDALWETRGNRAGPHRNTVIAALFEFDEVLSYPLPGSVGTHDMVRKARRRGGADTDPVRPGRGEKTADRLRTMGGRKPTQKRGNRTVADGERR